MKVANIEQSNASAKSTPAKGKDGRRPSVAEKRVSLLKAELKKFCDTYMQIVDVAKHSN